MQHLSSYSPYPSNAFAGLLHEMLTSLTASGAAPELVGTELIAFASLLTQGVANVRWPNGLEVPIGANSLLVAPSGAGKSLIYRILVEPIERYLAQDSKWKDAARRPDFLLEDASKEAIIQGLHGWPVAGLFTDEAGQINQLLKYSSTLVKLLDGAPLRNARISSGRVQLVGHCFSMLLMEQPAVFDATKVILGASNGGVGLLNRFFIARLNSFLPAGSLHQVRLTDHVHEAYHQRSQALLELTVEQVEKQTLKRPTLRLSAEAAQYLGTLDNEIRRNNVPGSPWFCCSEYIARHIERVLRLAGVFHVFAHGPDGEITTDTVWRAALLASWYIESFVQMTYAPPKRSQIEADAIELELAVGRIFHASGQTLFRQSDMRACALNLGLTPARFTRALATLGGHGKVRVRMQRNQPWIELNAAYFFQFR